MADVRVKAATMRDGRVETLVVALEGLPDRTIDRETAVSWMRDGHSLIPVRNEARLPALLLLEGADGSRIRFEGPGDDDQLPAL